MLLCMYIIKPVIKSSSSTYKCLESSCWWKCCDFGACEWTYEGGRKLLLVVTDGVTVPVIITECILVHIERSFYGNLGGTAGFLRLVPIGAGRFLIHWLDRRFYYEF